MEVNLTRTLINKNHCVGELRVMDGSKELFRCVTLERGWLDNKPNVSCVPTGSYPMKLEYSPAFDMNLWELKAVPGRSECKIHIANFWYQLEGCIAVGREFGFLDKDSEIDVLESRETLEKLHKVLSLDKGKTITININTKT